MRITLLILLGAMTPAATTHAAIWAYWREDPINADAFVIGNPSINGTLPPGTRSFFLIGVFTEGFRFGGGSMRLTLPFNQPSGGSFYRYSAFDAGTGGLSFAPITRPGSASATEPALQYSCFFSYPNVLADDVTSGGVQILAGLRPDGTVGLGAEVLPTINITEISVVWGSRTPPPQGDGQFVLARVTFSGVGIPYIEIGSKLNSILPSGESGPPFTFSYPLPEPSAFSLVPIVGAIAGLRARRFSPT